MNDSFKVAVLITGDPTETTGKQYGHYGNLFEELLGDGEAEWAFLDTRLEQYPTHPSEYDAYVLTGSASTAHENEAWIVKLKEFIQDAFENQKKILGICFGHQVVAGALGGKTEINPKGWEIGLVSLDWEQDWVQHCRNESIALPTTVLQVHRDHVASVPEGAEILASTSKTGIQVFRIKNQVLGIQGHPEFFNDIVADLVKRREKAGIISQKLGFEALDSLVNDPDRAHWVKWLRKFLYA